MTTSTKSACAFKALLCFIRRLCTYCAFLVFSAFLPIVAVAQVVPQTGQGVLQNPSAGAPQSPLMNDFQSSRSKLDAYKIELDQIEVTLRRQDLSDQTLQSLRQRIDPLNTNIRTLLSELEPRFLSAKERLDQLGPEPASGQTPESADVTKERTERKTALAQVDETQRLARALLVQAEQLASAITELRRTAFTTTLFQQSSHLFNPDLWINVLAGLPQDVNATKNLVQDWFNTLVNRLTWAKSIPLIVAFGIAGLLYGIRERVTRRFAAIRDPSVNNPSEQKKALAAWGVLLAGTLPAALSSFLIYIVMDQLGFLPFRVAPLFMSIMAGFVFIAFIRSLLDALLATDNRSWRMIELGDLAVQRLTRFGLTLATVLVFGKVAEALVQAIGSNLAMSVAVRGLFVAGCLVVLEETLRKSSDNPVEEEECLGPYIASEPDLVGPLKLLGWFAFAAILASLLTGYITFADFLVQQIVWIGILLMILRLALKLADSLMTGSLQGETRISTLIQANTGLRRRSLEQIGVLGSGAIRVALIIIAAMLALAPWGVESLNLVSSVRAAFFGFKVGDVSISLYTIIIAFILLGLGFAITRGVQGWLETRFLPATTLDTGLRNSIKTGFGYLGFIIATLMASSYLGLSLDKIAIVAGALSVGIGFGLQSIVNNFVSGLILLWERPIRVGDLIVVNDGEGHVRRINVRATEIETGDRSTIIVPNSNLISGVVRNRVRGDRTGRVGLSLSVPRNSNPETVAHIMKSCALDHPHILKEPGPAVLFKKIGETSLDFDLSALIDDVEIAGGIHSDLHFAIFKKLQEAGIGRPVPESIVTVNGLDRIEETLEDIADAMVEEVGHGAEPKDNHTSAAQTKTKKD